MIRPGTFYNEAVRVKSRTGLQNPRTITAPWPLRNVSHLYRRSVPGYIGISGQLNKLLKSVSPTEVGSLEPNQCTALSTMVNGVTTPSMGAFSKKGLRYFVGDRREELPSCRRSLPNRLQWQLQLHGVLVPLSSVFTSCSINYFLSY